MFVLRIREVYSSIGITETHPKALLKAIGKHINDFANEHGCTYIHSSDHERDALISAIAAREGFEGRWTMDLSAEPPPSESEQDPAHHWLGPIHYFWPSA